MADPVIAGIGCTAYSDSSGRLERALAAEAICTAVADAGLDLADIDGLVTFDLDTNNPLVMSRELALGPLSWFSATPYGGGLACAAVQDAALAIRAGLARAVVVYRAANMRSGQRYGQAGGVHPDAHDLTETSSHVGLLTPAHLASLWIHRYLHDRKLSNADLAPVVLAARAYAATNPTARFFGQTFTLSDYLESPWVAEPVLRVADCCLETDGAAALVVTRRDMKMGTAAAIRASARAMAAGSSIIQNFHRPDIGTFPDLGHVLQQLWAQSGIGARDLDGAIIYDAFSAFIPVALEEMGIVNGGDVAAFLADGGITLAGDLPVNPNGGQLAEAYLHGFNGMIEAVRQCRGSASNQISSVEHLLVTGGPALPTSGLILSPA